MRPRSFGLMPMPTIAGVAGMVGRRTASGGGRSSRPAARSARRSARSGRAPRRSQPLPPRIANGPLGRAEQLAAARPSRRRRVGLDRLVAAPASATSPLSVSMSSGSAITTGPGPAARSPRGRRGDTSSGMRAGVVDLRRPFGDPAEEARGSRSPGTPRARAWSRATWPTNRISGVESCRRCGCRRGVGRAGPAGDEADAGPAGQLAVGLRHHRGAALLAADRDGDRRVVQRVEDREVALAGHAEEMVDAVHDELVDENRRPPGLRVFAHASPPQFGSARTSAYVAPSPGDGRRLPAGMPSMTIGERTRRDRAALRLRGGQVHPHAAQRSPAGRRTRRRRC